MTEASDLKAQLRLCPEPPRVTWLSRKVLIGAGRVASIVVAGALFWALDTNRRGNQSSTELCNTENRTPADGLAGLPRDYTNIPKLGPALPGDLGRPIVRAQEEGRPVVTPNIQTPRADPEEERRLAEMEAARLAKLFTDSRGERTDGNQIDTTRAGTTGDPTTGLTLPAETPPLDAGSVQNMQGSQAGFRQRGER
jgi:type IV secretory pathway VirB10-like protein